MKKLLQKTLIIFFFLLNIGFSQTDVDTLIYKTGSKMAGTFLKLGPINVVFRFKGYDRDTYVGKTSVDSVKIGSCCHLDLITGEEINLGELARIAAEKEAEEARLAAERFKIKYLVLPLNNDKYARTKDYIKFLKNDGFNVISNYYALEYFSKNNIVINQINDFQIIKMAQTLNVDYVIFGDLFTIKEDFNYSPDLKAAADYQITQQAQKAGQLSPFGSDEQLQSLLRNTSNIFSDAAAENKMIQDSRNRSSAEQRAGTYLYETIYRIDVKEKNRIYLFENAIIKKF